METVYCVKCRKNVEPRDATTGPITWTNKKTGKEMKRNGISGTCPNCGKKVKQFRKGGSAVAPTS
jgi:endogenous inhibitor of DNA gyrase (YacG/DUF329 family)